MDFLQKLYMNYIPKNLILMFPLTFQYGTTIIIYDVEDDD
jgi:hypothetical protein